MEEAQLRSRYDQDLVVFLAIYAAPGASEIAVADALYERIDDINQVLPEDLELFMAFDISNYMRDSLREIVMTLGKPSYSWVLLSWRSWARSEQRSSR